MPGSARDLRIEDFTYELPPERIARFPTPARDGARQLHYRNGEIGEASFAELPDHLPPGTLLVGNRTRVIHARLYFPLPGTEGRTVELFCLSPLEPADHALSLGSTGPVHWKCLIGGNRRWKSGPLTLTVGDLQLTAHRLSRRDGAFTVAFSWTGPQPLTFGEVLEAAGDIPLPPYLGRAAGADDRDRYQTVFARAPGSVAAPTAGLHFTPDLIARLAARSVDWAEITLHVGAGTFKPVTSPTLADHVMHQEFFTVTRALLERLLGQLRAGRPVVSVGTTSLRCLESLYYLGARLRTAGVLDGVVPQWIAEDGSLAGVSPADAVATLLGYLADNDRADLSARTQLLLTPRAEIRIADGLITNFHQPQSTLLLLVAGLVGEDWRRIYDYALARGFRFLSYGDSSLLWRKAGRP